MDNWHKGLFLTIVVLVGIIVFLRQCGTQNCPEPKVVVRKVVTVEIDTMYLDTNKFKYLPIEIPKIIYDTVKVTVSEDDAINFDDGMIVKYYMDTITDDTVSIHYEAKTLGYLEELKIGYRLLQPYRIDKTTIIETNTTKIIKKRFQGLYLGLDIGGNESQFSHLAPMFELSTKNGWNYQAGYNIVNGSYIIGMRRRIKFKNPFKRRVKTAMAE